MKKVLLVGESWVSSSTHYKGFDQFGSVTFHTGHKRFMEGMKTGGYDVTHMPAHDAAADFPTTPDGLSDYDVIILSDIGANTLLLHPDVWLRGKRVANRINLLADWTAQGGGLIMIGGYFSFQGIDGKARWHKTSVEAALPVECMSSDDRMEIPEGCAPVVNMADHPILDGITGEWPYLLGVNEVKLKDAPEVKLILSLPETQRGLPLLATGQFGEGRTVAWMSDMSEHWLPPAFLEWDGYDRLFCNMIGWAARDI
ncbi:glutamine amidotransferase [Loktanella sp. TSTF-M6]|uniref:Glutamine amidotransferase n=1 Tax=Loktanella gaetbuli TaxID=2881335 RepID=A0ABS8BXL0_9RHOB|nr:glutamine amidotransferase [Loktanella gaetbuli]MCB5200482.1 glutamine amidotransferase [Loktanella gaetbuli]